MKLSGTERFRPFLHLMSCTSAVACGRWPVPREDIGITAGSSLSHHALSRVCVFVTVALGVRSKEGLPLVCLEFCLLTNLKANVNWIGSDLWNQRALPERGLLSRCLRTKATGPEL